MKTIVQIIFIAAVLFLGYTIATADGPLIVTTTDSQQPPAPQVIFIPAPVDVQEAAPTAVPVIYPIIIPNTPNPDPAAFITPEAATVEVEPETAVVNAGELEVVTAALRNSERAAGACLDAWVADSMAGRVPQSCAGILSQVNDLTVRRYELAYGGQ